MARRKAEYGPHTPIFPPLKNSDYSRKIDPLCLEPDIDSARSCFSIFAVLLTDLCLDIQTSLRLVCLAFRSILAVGIGGLSPSRSKFSFRVTERRKIPQRTQSVVVRPVYRSQLLNRSPSPRLEAAHCLGQRPRLTANFLAISRSHKPRLLSLGCQLRFVPSCARNS